MADENGIPADFGETYLFCSPFLSCIETAAAIAKEMRVSSLGVQDQLSDTMMKGWYPEDPFIGLQTKLTTNKDKFQGFLRMQYEIPELQIEYKRSTSAISYPETVDQTNKR